MSDVNERVTTGEEWLQEDVTRVDIKPGTMVLSWGLQVDLGRDDDDYFPIGFRTPEEGIRWAQEHLSVLYQDAADYLVDWIEEQVRDFKEDVLEERLETMTKELNGAPAQPAGNQSTEERHAAELTQEAKERVARLQVNINKIQRELDRLAQE